MPIKRGEFIEKIYGRMKTLSICTSIKVGSFLDTSILRGDGHVESNDSYIGRNLSEKLPEVLDKSNYYVYDLQRYR